MSAALILQLVLTYGPEAVSLIQSLVTKLEAGKTLTLADVELELAGLQPYGAYGVRQVTGVTPTPITA